MILLAYRHGLRASELCSLRWDMLDLSQGRYPSPAALRATSLFVDDDLRPFDDQWAFLQEEERATAGVSAYME
jgi:integrase